MLVGNRDRDLGVLAERDLRIAIPAILRGPSHHVSHSGGQEDAPLGVGVLRQGRIELRIVVDLEVHQSTVHRRAVLVHDREIHPGSLGVVVDQIDFREVRADHHLLLRAVVAAEHPRVHQ